MPALRPLMTLTALALAACGATQGDETPSPTAATPSPEAGVALSAARYSVDWDWGAAAPLAGGVGWQVTNDLGYTVTVEGGYLVDYTLSLVPCGGSSAAYRRDPLNHDAFSDPSELSTPHVEDLSAPAAALLEELTFPEARYCDAYYLVGRIIDEGEGLPESMDLTGISLTLWGAITLGEDTWPLNVETSFANAAFFDLPTDTEGGIAGEMPGEMTGADLTLTRSLGELFEGVDPEAMEEDAIAWQLLSNLLGGSTLETTLSAR